MDNNRADSFCCGSCGNLPFVYPQLADTLAKERIAQAKRIGVKKIVVASFDNYNLLRKNAEGTGIEIVELSEVIAQGLDIPRITGEEEIEGEEKILSETKIVPILTGLGKEDEDNRDD